jgi:hypothetical protein
LLANRHTGIRVLLTLVFSTCFSVQMPTLPMDLSGGLRFILISMRRVLSSTSTLRSLSRSTSTSSSTQLSSNSNGARLPRLNLAVVTLMVFLKVLLTSGLILTLLLTPRFLMSISSVMFKLLGTLLSGELNDNY